MRRFSFLCLLFALGVSTTARADVRLLHSHVAGPIDPASGLISDGLGNLYGTTEYGGDGGAGTVFTVREDGTGFRILRSFLPSNQTDGSSPRGPLVLDGSGNLYGTTSRGGEGAGTVFTLRTDGSGYRTLRPFSGPDVLEVRPSLLLDGSGFLYGAASGPSGSGRIFRMKTDGSGFAVLHVFGVDTPDLGLSEPTALDGAGTLYGTACCGTSGGGVYAMGTDGSNFRIVHAFGDGAMPNSNLVLDGSGRIFGTTSAGGSADAGFVFALKTDGTGFASIHEFSSGVDPGGSSRISITLDATVLYATSEPQSRSYGSPGQGTVFRLGTDGSAFAVLHAFSAVQGFASGPHGPLLRVGPDRLVGTTARDGAIGADTIFSLRTDGATFDTLLDFAALSTDGHSPAAGLVADGSGNLYGTTSFPGVVFTLKSDGTGYRLLHTFAGGTSDGLYPAASLVLDGSGNLYGTTQRGGPSNVGTVFTLRTDGTLFHNLHAFSGSDGDSPEAALILGSSGTLYGTTRYGGIGSLGTIFSIKTDGSAFRTLRSLSNPDGVMPRAGLVQDLVGRLYGTTSEFGLHGSGTVFSILPDGTDFHVLHDFVGFLLDGEEPAAPLFLDGSGNLFGTAPSGGSVLNPGLSGNGVVYTLRTDGSGYKVLHIFADVDGSFSVAPLTQDPWGNLYGTTSRQSGTIFTLRPDGSGFRVLHTFHYAPSDGFAPLAGLVRDAVGNLFGTTSLGGSANTGAEYVLKDLCSAAPDITVVEGSNPTCLGSPLTLDAGDGYTSYLWSTGATTRTITVSPASATTYSVTGTVAGCPGPNPAGSLTVTISTAIPAAPVPMNDGPKCEGDTVQLSLDIVPGATYSWIGPNGFTSSQPVPVIPHARPSDSGDYFVTSTLDGCTSLPAKTSVVVNARPAIPVLTVPAFVQSGETFTASVPAAAGVGFNWYVSNATILSGNGTNSVVLKAGRSPHVGILVGAFTIATGCHSSFATSGGVTVQVSSTFHPLPPCRVFDTRATQGPSAAAPSFSSHEQRALGVAGRCGVPSTALAVSANVTATAAQAAGGFGLDLGYSSLDVVSFGAGQTRANGAIVSLWPNGSIFVWNHANGTVHFIFDVNGYFE